jgi:uncharacterized protein
MFTFDRFFYYPDQAIYGSPEDHGFTYESVVFPGENGLRLHGWFFPAVGRAQGTVVHFHGNAGNITGHFEAVAWLPAAGWNVFCFDYRGYGRSQGTVTRAGTVSDGHAAIDYVRSRQDVDGDHIVVFGQSLGGAVGIVVAAEQPEIRGLAAEGAFGSYQRMARHVCRHQWYTWGIAGIISDWMISLGYDAEDYIGRISPRPVYLFHGTADDIVPYEMSNHLFSVAGDPKEIWLAEGLGHTDSLFELPNVARPRLTCFFDRCLDGRSALI